MIQIQLAVPDELTLVLQAEQAKLAAEVSMAAAVKLSGLYFKTAVSEPPGGLWCS